MGAKERNKYKNGMFSHSKTANIEVMNPDLFQYIFQDENPIIIA